MKKIKLRFWLGSNSLCYMCQGLHLPCPPNREIRCQLHYACLTVTLDLNASTLLNKPKDSRKQPLDGRPPSAAAAFTPRETLIFIFLVLTKQGTGEGGCPRRSGFNINGDSVKQANTGGGSWLPPHPGPHINEIMPQCSQLQPLSDRRLYSRTTPHPLSPSQSPFLHMHTYWKDLVFETI